MSDTADRLQRYKDAETRILKGQQFRMDGRILTLADLAEVTKQIDKLSAQLAAETSAAKGNYGPRVMVADFSKPLR
ncbi:MAG TPA: hypothetical protein VHE37_11995 [Nevskiaceae bacterium]|nr:hypothetical protein [Nevskiaceae bacterium]